MIGSNPCTKRYMLHTTRYMPYNQHYTKTYAVRHCEEGCTRRYVPTRQSNILETASLRSQ